ncbi:MAG: hypothetical protein ABI273_11135 [Lacunisphaera sp.]
MSPLPRLALLLIALGCSGPAVAALLPPTEIKPNTSVVRYADTHHIPLSGFELGSAEDPSRAGDQLIVLFTIQEGVHSRQWLGEFRFATLTAHEAKLKPGTGLGILSYFQSSLKTDTGREFSFEQSPVALEVSIRGPFTGDDPATQPVVETTARVLATNDYLAHGLAPMADIELRLRARGKENPGISLMFRPRYSAQQMAATTARAKDAGFTEDDERAYAEAIYALVQFGNLSFKTDGIDVITHEMADSPTLFSGAFTNLVWPAMQLEDGGHWGLPGSRIFRVPYNFLSKTTAHGTFYFTAVRPPLRNLAGFVGLTVDTTSKTANKRLIMRVLAGRLGAK